MLPKIEDASEVAVCLVCELCRLCRQSSLSIDKSHQYSIVYPNYRMMFHQKGNKVFQSQTNNR